MLGLKSELFGIRGRYEESVLIADAMLNRDPDSIEALQNKTYGLLKLGRPQEALAVLNKIDEIYGFKMGEEGTAAAIHYELAHYETAAQLARTAITAMSHEDLRNPDRVPSA